MPTGPSSAAIRRQPAQARGQARRDSILDAAAELLTGGGTDALTTNAIARTAGTSVGSIYEYFAGREAIAEALAGRLADRYGAAPVRRAPPTALAAALVDQFVSWWAADPAIAPLWWSASGPSALGPAGVVLVDHVVAATATTIVERARPVDRRRARRVAELTVSLVSGLLHGAGPSGPRGELRRTATLAVGAFLAVELPAPADSGQTGDDQHVDVGPPSTGRAGRMLDGRQRMLDAAVDRLVVEGYGGATTLAIQARAGVSRGRLLHQFPSRDLLLVAAAGHLADQRVRATQRRVVETVRADREGVRRVDHVVELMWASYQEPHYWAASELWMAARTNPEIAVALRPHERRLGATIRAAVGEMFGPPFVDDPRFAMLRDVLLTSMRGVAAAYAFEQRDAEREPFLATWQDLAHLVLGVNSQP